MSRKIHIGMSRIYLTEFVNAFYLMADSLRYSFNHFFSSFKQFIHPKGVNIGIQSFDPQMALFFHTIYIWITTRNSIFDLVLVRAHSFLYFLNVLGFAAFLHKSNRKCLMVSGIITNKSHFNNHELEVKFIEFVLKSGHRRHCIQRTSAIVSYNI